MKHKMHIIANTHWDREHRHGFQETRIMLTRLIDKLLDIMENDPQYEHFILDGQTVVLDDYFELKPQQREKVENLVRAGRLHVGPWYTLPDMFGCAPEAIVRNLLKGHRVAESVGGVMKLGYSIFSFGQISQLPQIYNGFGINEIVFYKGANPEVIAKSEFWWEAPDGTRLLATRLGQHGRWNFYWKFVLPVLLGGSPDDGPDWRARFTDGSALCHMIDGQFRKYPSLELERDIHIRPERIRQGVLNTMETCKPFTRAKKSLIFFDGTDFTEPLAETTEALRQANAICADIGKLVMSTPMRFMADLRKELDLDALQVHRGELRMGPLAHIQSESMNANCEIKRALATAERTILNVAEPFAMFASLLGEEYPRAELDRAWKYLFQVHAHDSVHGLGQPKIKRDSLYRIEQAQEIGDVVGRMALEQVTHHIDKSAMDADDMMVAVYNGTATARGEVMEIQIDLPREENVREWWLETLDGQRVDMYQLQGPCPETLGMISPEGRPKPVYVDRYLAVVLVPEVPPFGYRTLRVKRVTGETARPAELFSPGQFPSAPIARSPRLLDNGVLRVEVNHDGTVSLTDLASRRRYDGLLEYTDRGCRGDTWTHHPPDRDRELSSIGCPTRIEIISNSGLCATVAVTTEMRVPKELTADTEGRSPEMVELTLRTELTLARGSRRLDVRTSFENRARDHFLRVHIPTGVKTQTCVSDGPFDVLDRTFGVSDNHGRLGSEMIRQPMCNWVDVSDGRHGLAVFTHSTKEYGLDSKDGGAVIELSLMRAVNGAFPIDGAVILKTDDPFSQCLGEQWFEFALYPHPGDWAAADLPRRCAEYLRPLLAMEFGKGRRNGGELPLESASLLRFRNNGLCFSGLKQAEDGEGWILRVYNPSANPVRDEIRWLRRPVVANEVRLDETPLRALTIRKDGAVAVTVKPGQIMTLKVAFDHAN